MSKVSDSGQALCLLGSTEQLHSHQQVPEQSAKKRAACDECRKRKLRCSGEPAGCSRCVKHQIPCHYSIQKPMGRPRKRHRQEEEPQLLQDKDCTAPKSIQGLPVAYDPETLSNFPHTDSLDAADFLISDDFDPKIYPDDVPANNIWIPQSQDQIPKPPHADRDVWPNDHFNSLSTEDTPPSDSLPTPPPFTNTPNNNELEPRRPADTTTWNTDYANFSRPAIVGNLALDPDPLLPLSGQSEQTCACLSNLYLTLSSLSPLQSVNTTPGQPSPNVRSIFPLVTPATINSLRMASREAYRVIHCSMCPRSFQTSIQNLMLLCTLISVLGDIWGRLSRAPIDDVRMGLAAGTHNANSMEDADWRSLIWRLVRKGLYGRSENSNYWHYLEGDDERCDKWYSLAYLINSVERRQKTWHGQPQDDGEFPGKKDRWACSEDPRVKFGSIRSPSSGEMSGQTHAHRRGRYDGPGREGEAESKTCGMQNETGEDSLCLKIVDQVRGIMEALKLDDEVTRS